MGKKSINVWCPAWFRAAIPRGRHSQGPPFPASVRPTPGYQKQPPVAKEFFHRSMGGDLAPNLGGTKKIFRGPISGKMSIFRVKISDDIFFSHRLGSSH